MRLILEIRAAEGGDDAKALVAVQAAIYEAYALRQGLRTAKQAGHGWLLLTVEGPAAAVSPLRLENGGHRWQRVPPGERRSRVHTSTVTVAALEPADTPAISLQRDDVDMRFTRDTGPGGQHRNKTDSCVVLTHKATGLSVKVDGRDQHANRREAFHTLEVRLAQLQAAQAHLARNAQRTRQVGSGERGDKVRTYRTQDDRVTDHRTDRVARLTKVLQGELQGLAG